MNGDGLLDVITTNAADDSVSVLLDRGDDSFDTQRVFPTGSRSQSIAVADVDGDRRPDVLVSHQASGDLRRHWLRLSGHALRAVELHAAVASAVSEQAGGGGSLPVYGCTIPGPDSSAVWILSTTGLNR